jgi:inosose dehydratase
MSTSASTTVRVAANPIPYWWVDGVENKTREVFDAAFRDFQQIGFSAVKADVPAGMTAQEYLTWIRSYGLSPAVSLFETSFDQLGGFDSVLERARRFADIQVELGMNVTMLCALWADERRAAPAVGTAFDRGRMDTVIENMGSLCQVVLAAGLKPLLHPHVGGWVETEDEISDVLDTLGPDVIGFGPDTGHMRWAGMEPERMIARYSDRVGAIHIKDVFPEFLDRRNAKGMTYDEVEVTGRLWAEPGRGVVDFDAVVAAMPREFNGDYMIEVDVPSVATAFESHKLSFEWAKQALPAA